ncbi:MAG: QueT transporter family protein [Ruminococcaceae bacterium]|nr:QueT transporter family protein [Oscillospiraceae bacterium]
MKKQIKRNNVQRVRFLCTAAIIAALYVALTYVSMFLGLDKNAIQIRFSEALCVLAFVTPAAVPGMTVGCLLANILTGCAPLDILLGPIATFIGAIGAYLIGKMRNVNVARWICTVPNIVSNTVIVTVVCFFCYTAPSAQTWEIVPFYAATVFIGEVISCGVIGTVLLRSSEKILCRIC